MHIDLLGHGGGDFVGAVIASYRATERDPFKTITKPVSWPRAEVAAFVTELRAAISAPAESARRLQVSDSSRSVYLAFDLIGHGEGVQFAVDDGESTPLHWKLRGCPIEISDEHRRALTERWHAVLARFGVEALYTELTGAAP